MRDSIRTRLLLSFLAIAIAAAGGLSLYFLDELEEYGLRNLEARLDAEAVLTAALLAGISEEAGDAGELPRSWSERIDEALGIVGPEVTTRLRVLGPDGSTVADSVSDVEEDLSDRSEVVRALAGGYGANTRVSEDGRVALYVARPIVSSDGSVLGAVYTSSTTFSIMTLLRDYRSQLLTVLLAFIAVTVVTTELLARWLARPLTDLERGTKAITAGDHSARVTPGGARETRTAAEAFNVMGAEIESVVSELKEEEERKARFVSDVSHELKTPLTSIRGAAETMMAGDLDADDSRRFLGTIVRESERLSRLASDLLVLERIEGATGELRLTTVDLGLLARQAIEALDPLLAERGISVLVDGAAPTVLGDSDRLQQVVSNLVDNASRITPPDGEVAVRLGSEGALATLEVLDQGPGIADEDLPHVFERFYRTQQSRARTSGGVGLGLAIVRAIVEVHGGTVTAEPHADTGARFVVRLPSHAG